MSEPREKCHVYSYGLVPYPQGLALQYSAAGEVAAGGEDRLILLEHEPVLTMGRGGHRTTSECRDLS